MAYTEEGVAPPDTDTLVGLVYALSCSCHASGIRYVGMTGQRLSVRMSQHFSDSRRQRRGLPVHRWIAKHGVENIVFETIWTGPLSEMPSREIALISEIRPDLNLTAGGDGGLNPSPETRAKIAAAASARMLRHEVEGTWWWREKFFAATRQPRRPKTDAERDHLSRVKTGTRASLETRAKMSHSHKARGTRPPSPLGEMNPRASISQKCAQEIWDAILDGNSNRQIVDMYDLQSLSIPNNMRRGLTWKEVTGRG